MEAKTIHRLLEYKPPEGYQKNEEHPLEGDVLILDEVLGLIPYGIAGEAELRNLLEVRSASTDLYMTGVYGAREIWDAVDEVTELVAHKSLVQDSKTAVDKENQ